MRVPGGRFVTHSAALRAASLLVVLLLLFVHNGTSPSLYLTCRFYDSRPLLFVNIHSALSASLPGVFLFVLAAGRTDKEGDRGATAHRYET